MQLSPPPRPVLLFACGNPSRGDDALGPMICERIQAQQRDTGSFPDLDLLTDFQFQIEHALDLQQRRWVVFVDASLTVKPPFAFYPLHAHRDTTFTTHAMSPAAVLAVYRQLYGQPPPAYMLSIRGDDFALGRPLSTRAQEYLEAALAFVNRLPFDQPFDETGIATQFCT